MIEIATGRETFQDMYVTCYKSEDFETIENLKIYQSRMQTLSIPNIFSPWPAQADSEPELLVGY